MDADDRAYDPVGSEPVYYENNLAVQGDTLLEIPVVSGTKKAGFHPKQGATVFLFKRNNICYTTL